MRCQDLKIPILIRTLKPDPYQAFEVVVKGSSYRVFSLKFPWLFDYNLNDRFL